MRKCLPAHPLIIRVLKAPFARWHLKYLGKISHQSSFAIMSHGVVFPCNSNCKPGEEARRGKPLPGRSEAESSQLSVQMGF